MGFLEQLKGSLTDWEFYNAVVFQRARKTLKYFFILFTILFILTGTKTAIGLSRDFEIFAQEFREKVPDFELAGGEFTFAGEQPYILEGQQNAALIIDTTGATEQKVLDNYLDGVLITKDHMYIKQEMQIRQINFDDYKGTRLDKARVSALLDKLPWLIPAIMVLGYVAQVAAKMISTVFLALVGMFINNSRKGQLKFGSLWNIAVYALTLPLLLETVVKLVYPQLPSFFLVYYGVAIVYVAKAVTQVLSTTDNGSHQG